MTSWSLVLIFTYGLTTLNMQSEDACVIAAKQITSKTLTVAFCVDEFEGRALLFEKGEQR